MYAVMRSLMVMTNRDWRDTAFCRTHPTLWDGKHTSEQASRWCASCPALDPCTTDRDSLPFTPSEVTWAGRWFPATR